MDQCDPAILMNAAAEGNRATAFVHEAYLKLAGPGKISWQSRARFCARAAEAMRGIPIGHARAKATATRGGPETRRAAINRSALPDLASETESAGFMILDEAIVRLESVDQHAATVVRLRCFAGLGIEQTAATMGVAPPAVKRTRAIARGWLKEALKLVEPEPLAGAWHAGIQSRATSPTL